MVGTKTSGTGKGNKTNNPAGRPKGVPNKATTKAREAIAKLVDGNAERLVGWLDRVAEDNPGEAFKLLSAVMEFHLPKLARTEQQQLDKDGNAADALNKIEVVIVKSTDTNT